MSTAHDQMVKRLISSGLLKSASVYTLSRVINSAIPFLMMPVLTRFLTPTDYGVVAMFSLLCGLVNPFIGVNLNGAINIRYFDKSESNLPRYIGNCFMIVVVSSVLVSVFFYLFSSPISVLASFPRAWLWTIVVVSISQFVSSVVMTLWQADNQAVKFAVFQNSQTVVNLGLSLVFVVLLGQSWRGRIEAQVITAVVFAGVSLLYLYYHRQVRVAYHRPAFENALRFGLPLIPHALGGIMIVQTDRFFLANMAGLAAVGIYTIGYQLGSIIELLAASFNQAYAPWLYAKLQNNDADKKVFIVKATYLYFALILLAALALSFVAPWFLSFFVGKDFYAAKQYVFWIALGYAFNGMYYMVANYIFFAERTWALAWVTFFAAVLNVVFNYVLIKSNGPVGAAQASALTFFISFLMTWILSSRVCEMPWKASLSWI